MQHLSNPVASAFDCSILPRAAGGLPRAPQSWHASGLGLRSVLRALLPQQCQLCAGRSAHALVCAACKQVLPRIDDACPRCALPWTAPFVLHDVGGTAPSAPNRARRPCGACLSRPPPFEAAIAALRYAWPVDRLLQRLKYGHALALADWAAEALADAVARRMLDADAPPLPDALVALPLPASRLRERGFNQAREIARGVAARLDLPLADLVERVRDGPPQASLAWKGRRRNVRAAFAARGACRGWNVAIVDDVMTTGATMAEVARTLRGAGAARVQAWAVARTPPNARG